MNKDLKLNTAEKHMIDNIKSKVVQDRRNIRRNIEAIAELQAEIYVSSTMGIEDGEEKQNIKDTYIEEFINQVKQII